MDILLLNHYEGLSRLPLPCMVHLSLEAEIGQEKRPAAALAATKSLSSGA